MKRYITPKIKISMFQSIIETADPVIASSVTPEYVTGLEKIDKKAKVNLTEMKEITQFTF